MSNFADAVRMMRLEEIRLIRQIMIEHYRNWGSFPTEAQIAAQLHLQETHK